MTLFVNHVAPVLLNIYGITTIRILRYLWPKLYNWWREFILRTLEKGHSRAGEIPKMHGEFPKNILFLVGK